MYDSGDDDIDEIHALKALPPKVPIQRHSEPKITDWDPMEPTKERTHGKFRRRRTAPSAENELSSSGPIFRGRKISRSPMLVSSNSLSNLSQSRQDLRQQIGSPMCFIQNDPSTFDPFQLCEKDLRDFIFTNTPPNHHTLIHCCLRRDREGFQKNFSPTFYLHLESPESGKKVLLLAARKVPKLNGLSKYIITATVEHLSEKLGGIGYAGKLQCTNILGTEYILYDCGVNPHKYKGKDPPHRVIVRRELAAILYNKNVKGFSGPRKMNVVIPKYGCNLQPMKGEDTLMDYWHNDDQTCVDFLKNLTPKHDEKLNCYTIDSSLDRASPLSIKNFQLMMNPETESEQRVLEFLRIKDEIFSCDYRYPLSPIQAFGIALSAFDSRITRE